MPSLSKNTSLIIILVLVTFLILFNWYRKSRNTNLNKPFNNFPTENNDTQSNDFLDNDKQITLNNITINIQLADSAEERKNGLSRIEKIADDEGLLFVFSKPNYPAFWMKEMKFPLDIIWIRDDNVVDITKNVPNPNPETTDKELELYKPKELVNYVLEVNAGFVEKNNINIGDTAVIE